jgi:hypothetical protein
MDVPSPFKVNWLHARGTRGMVVVNGEVKSVGKNSKKLEVKA